MCTGGAGARHYPRSVHTAMYKQNVLQCTLVMSTLNSNLQVVS